MVAGEPDGLATAYDRYADPLYTYCRSILADPADAADAVQDTFVIAASRIESLRVPERLRAWLYAIARNECLRQLRDNKRASALDQASEGTDEGADVNEDAERAELRELVREAGAGLNHGDREVIELHLRHEMEAAEVAGVLGVSRNHAHMLLSRARHQLAGCMGVLLVGRTGRADCHELSDMLGDWDGHLSVTLHKRLYRHIQRCARCERRRAFAFGPAMVREGGAALAATTLVAAPAALRAEVLYLATGQVPTAMAYRAAVLAKAGSFGEHGFPKPAHGPEGAGHRVSWLKSPRGRAAVTAGAVVAVTVASVVFAMNGNPGHVKLAGTDPTSAQVTSPSPPPAPKVAATQHADPPATQPPVTTSPAGPPSPTSTSPQSPTPGPSTSAPAPATPGPTSSPAPPPTPGTLAVSPAGGSLRVNPGRGATITLTAVGGPVSWTAADTSGGTNGELTISPASGDLAAGRSVTVTIRTTGQAHGLVVTVTPGNTTFVISAGGDRTR